MNFKKILFISFLVLSLALSWDHIYTTGQRILPVMELPQKEAFFNETAGSYYDLAYIFPQKKFLGLVISSSYCNGSYALVFEDKNLIPYQLSSAELLHFLATNNLPTPSKLPSYPLYEHPVIFYLIAAMFLFFIMKKSVVHLSAYIPSKKIKNKSRRFSKRTIYAGYLRRRY